LLASFETHFDESLDRSLPACERSIEELKVSDVLVCFDEICQLVLENFGGTVDPMQT